MNYQNTRNIFFLLLTSFLASYQGGSLASTLNWKIHPHLNIREIYSDNITLSKNNPKSAFVTEFTPGVLINGTSARGNIDLNYDLQGLYNAQGREEVDLYNQLQMNTDYEFIDNRFFVDSSASISQQNISNRRIAGDNISGTEDSSTISTFQVSPYWTPHFEGIADGEVRLTYDTVSSSGGNNALSDTNSFSQNVFFQSGHDLSLLSWSLSFNNSKRFNSKSEDISFQDSQAEIRYAIGRKYSVFARGGHSNNSFASNSNSSSNNGFFYTFGGQWEPSKRFRLEAGYGNNKFVTVEISPFNRLHWISTYSYNDIGLNTGSTWSSQLDYTTRRATWRLGYSETTTTTQQLLLDQQVSNTSNTGFTGYNTSLPTLTDEVFTTQNADISFSFQTGKSNISSRFFKIYRSFELSSNEEVTGATGSWNWDFTKRTSSNLQLGWQKTESSGLNSFTDKRFDVSVFITRRILKHLDGSIGYSYLDQDSTSNLNSYIENRITANLSLQF